MAIKDKRLRALLVEGYFPIQLPPPFLTETLGKISLDLDNHFPVAKTLQSECESYSVARVGYRRRTTKLPNPISQFLLSRCIAENWPKVSKHLKRSKISLSNPDLSTVKGERPVQIPSLGELESERVLRSAGYRFAVISDITQFFPSLYTHALPWALHTKAAAKKALKVKPKASAGYGEDLDKHARNCQSQQTIGVPIGPDTSHILAEIVAVGVDLELKSNLKRWPAGYRYVDDFALFFSSRSEADAALSDLNQALAFYELRSNEHKTRIVPVDNLEVDAWAHELRHFEFSHTKSRQIQELHSFFRAAFARATENPHESVMKFALRRVAVELIRKDSWPVFESYLLRVAHTYPDTLQLVAQFLYTYSGAQYPIGEAALKRTISTLLQEHAPRAHHSEIAWCLWIAIQHSIKLPSKIVQAVLFAKSSVCTLLALHLESKGLVSGKLAIAAAKKICNESALYTSDWLLAYQAERDSIFSGISPYVAGNIDFSLLLSKGVTFYNKGATQKPLFTVKSPAKKKPPSGGVFNLEKNPNEFIEFSDVDEDYID